MGASLRGAVHQLRASLELMLELALHESARRRRPVDEDETLLAMAKALLDDFTWRSAPLASTPTWEFFPKKTNFILKKPV